VTRRAARRAAKASLLDLAARTLSIVNAKRVPGTVRDEAEELAAELVALANGIR
jgi:hypothetical protein